MLRKQHIKKIKKKGKEKNGKWFWNIQIHIN
jgi:hypothetical protein